MTRFVRDFLAGLLGSSSRRDPLGPLGEKIAARFLRRAGYRILGVNLRLPSGEADILALAPDRSTIVLVEVKTRRTNERGAGVAAPPPEASVDSHKREKLRAILRELVRANGWQSRGRRIDVVAVELSEEAPPVIRHTPGAVELRASA